MPVWCRRRDLRQKLDASCATTLGAGQFVALKGLPSMDDHNSLPRCRSTRLKRGALLAAAGLMFCLGLASWQIQGMAKVRSAGSLHNAIGTEQDGFVGSQSCSPCHQNIYDKFAKTNMGRSMTRVAPGLLENLVTSASLHDEKLDQHFEVFARDGKLLQNQYAVEAGGSEIFRETHEVRWIIGSGTNGFAAVTTNGPYLFQGPLSFYSKIGTWALSPGYEFGNYGFNRPILAGCAACHSGQAMPAGAGNG